MVQNWEKIMVKGIAFKFQNNHLYVDETEKLRDVFKTIAVPLEGYLADKTSR